MSCPRHESSPLTKERATSCPVMNERERGLHTLEGAPLGPDSLLWKLMDSRLFFAGLPAGILQTMYKAIAGGLKDHSNFVNEPIERVLRSMEPITETVFGTKESAKAAGAAIVGYHHTIKGTHDDGSRYHALDPQVFADTHLTFVYPIFQIAEKYDKNGLNLDQKRQLYKECITWFQNYPVSDRCLPPDYESYLERWDELCENEFNVDSDVSAWTLDFAKRGEIPRPNVVPEKAWSLMKFPLKPTAHVMGKLIIDGIPAEVRENNNIPFTDADLELVDAFQNMIKDTWDFLPESMKYPPQAYEALKRERAKHGETTLEDRAHTLGSHVLKTSFNTLNTVRENLPVPKTLNPVKLFGGFVRKRTPFSRLVA
jgi:uncharacterized protein (DUF2236 family)